MSLIYWDHNVIASIAGNPAATWADTHREHAREILRCGHRFALSAWNMYELALSNVSARRAHVVLRSGLQ